jgi:hypothetical protein
VADLLKLLLKIRSREIDVASRLLARSDDLEALAAGQRKGLALLESWRYEQFGRDALELVEGRSPLPSSTASSRWRTSTISAATARPPAPAPEESGGE